MEVDTKPNLMARPATVKPDAENSIQTTDDMATFVKDLLWKMNCNFEKLAAGILSRSKKVDEIENSINAIKAESETQAPVQPDSDKPKPESNEPKPEADLPDPEGDVPKPEADMTKPESDEPECNSDEPMPDSDEPMPDSDKPKSNSDEPTPDSDKPKPSADMPMTSSDEPKADPVAEAI